MFLALTIRAVRSSAAFILTITGFEDDIPAMEQPALATAGIPDDNGDVVISMAWITMMAQVAQQFLPVDVDQLMGQFAVQQGQTVPDSVTQSTGGDFGVVLLARNWVA